MLRRWRLAKSRVASLSLPEIPAYEQIKGIQAMIKTLEKKYDSLRTLVRILPDVQLGRPQGVVILLDTVEAELRQLAADEMSRDLAKEDDSSIAAKGIRARTKEVQARIRAPRERARTRLEERAAQSKDPKLQQHLTPQHWLEQMMRKDTGAKPRLSQRPRPRRQQ